MNNMFLMFNTAPQAVRRRAGAPGAALRHRHAEDDRGGASRGTAGARVSFLNARQPDVPPAKTVYDYDPDKAKKLLGGAGVQRASVALMAVNVSWIMDCLPTIKASWDAIGVKTTLDPQETTAVFTKMDQKKDYQVVAAASNPNQFGLDADLIMRYNYAPVEPVDGLRALGRAAPTAKHLFTLMDQATARAGPGKKKTMTQEYIDIVAEQAVLYPVVHNELMTAWDPKKITGVQAQPYPGINVLQAKPA